METVLGSRPVYLAIVGAWMLLAAVAFGALRRRAAPYGRHQATPERGVPSRVAWVLMEFPSAVSFAFVTLCMGRPRSAQGCVLLILWLAHYLHRGLVYPLRIRSPKRVPMWVVCSAFVFTTINGALNAWSLFGIGPELGGVSVFHPRSVVGIALFLIGAAINIDADNRLLAAPRGPGGGYTIPRGGLYRFVSSPNYLGELVEWTGWALASGTSAGLAFLVWTAANLVPRARANHAWYRRTFPDYPAERRALWPWVDRKPVP